MHCNMIIINLSNLPDVKNFFLAFPIVGTKVLVYVYFIYKLVLTVPSMLHVRSAFNSMQSFSFKLFYLFVLCTVI